MTVETHDDEHEPAAHGETTAEDVVSRGIDALQSAAAEAISAARAVLDVAEELLTDPRTAAVVSNMIGSMARSTLRSRPEPPDEEDGVQRIPVS